MDTGEDLVDDGNVLPMSRVPQGMSIDASPESHHDRLRNRVVRQNAFGGPEHISIEERTAPDPGPGEALVRVHAAGLNPVDWQIPADPSVAQEFGVSVPGGYGHDLAGVVAAVGSGTSAVQVGDRVLGGARGAAIADFAIVPAGRLTLVPYAVPLNVAATLPIAARTAAAAISLLELTPDDTVLIGGAAGGVGVLAVQFAVRTGATVVATASPANHDFLRSLGAIPVSYRDGLADAVRDLGVTITAATDLQGAETARAALDLGVAAARITTIATEPIPGTIPTGGMDAPAGTIPQVLDDLAVGDVRVQISGEYPIERTAEAVARLREGHVRGKLVITTGAA
ncbi:NADP-dependent oxidoreductase [Microbacterium sp. KUDC0406]|uniref:NADP-dependent oxidoreductase n=1 Tax=Microbacterium sp. KUDC0406 TaxID=2909588 RepID=UPI001F19A136|nr:NADP-dependent oxidoreductase [Microbacterium sp. KUDC0406]UJP10351.1 NADP-dependent oxidoreductase [Microbacterium sp. KUDC0406]